MILTLLASTGNNRKLADTLETIETELGMKYERANLVDLDLPLFVPSSPDGEIPQAALRLRREIEAADGFLVIAPEYNGGVPPVFSNAIAWVSCIHKDDWRKAFNGKVAVVATHSGGQGYKVLHTLRQQLEHMGCTVLAREVLTNYGKELNPKSARGILGQLKSMVTREN